MKKLLNQCPVCGGKIEYYALMQYNKIYAVNKNGNLSKRSRKEDVGSMECGFLSCINSDFLTDCDFNCTTHNQIKIYQEGGKFYYDEIN